MNSRTGYSILEVLVAFAIMSMTLAVLIPGQTRLLVRASQVTDRALAHDLALSRLDEAHVLGAPRDEIYRNWRIKTSAGTVPETRTLTITVINATGRTLAQAARRIVHSNAD